MKNKALTYLLVGILSLSLIGCGKKEEPTVSTEIEKNVSVQEEVPEEEIQESLEPLTDETEQEIELSKYELMSQNEFWECYSILQGYFVNNDVTYFYYSYLKDGDVVYFYTRSDEPDNWYTYEITSTELIGELSVDNQYRNHKTAVTVTDNHGNVKEMEFNLLQDTFNQSYTLDIVDGGEVINLKRLSNETNEFGSAYKYLKFVDLDVDESGNISLEFVDVSDGQLNGVVNEDLCFGNDNSDSYHLFTRDDDSFVYDGYVYVYNEYCENGLENIKYNLMDRSFFPVEYRLVSNPYLSEESEGLAKHGYIPLSEEILSGYSFRVSEEQYLTYNGVEDLVLGEYVYYEDSSSDLNVHMNLVTEDGEEAVRVEFEENETYEKALAGELDWVSGKGNLRDYFEGEDYFVYYDENAEENSIAVLFNKNDLTYKLIIEPNELDNEYENEVAELRKIADAFTVSGDEKTVDDYLKETIKFGDYSFAEDVRFEGIYRGETTNGFERLEGENFTYCFTDETYNLTQLNASTVDIVYVPEGEFAGEFEITGWINSYTIKEQRVKEYKRFELSISDEPQKVLIIGQGDGFSSVGRYTDEIEEDSKNYLMNKIKNILVKN